ncbi:hypothetical protein [Nocardia noduli]|uniref:hypothetical protein n=1 Tax=Nocardia noduli TaxID=2815722 RepID=UPI001C2161E3|nr:hypothetical protein [Nocardia noduli]
MTTDDHSDLMMNLSACTLPTVQRPTRLAEFDAFFADSVRTARRADSTRLELTLIDTSDAEPVGRDLAARESTCCSFFTFTFEDTPAGTVMRIEAPVAYVEVLDALTERARAALAGAGR